MKKLVFTILCIAVLVGVSIPFALPASASTTIYVPDNYSTIQAAVNAANPGDTIIVRNGLYTESNIRVDKDGLIIKSQSGYSSAVIDAAGGGAGFRLYGNSIRIEGFTVRNGYNYGIETNGFTYGHIIMKNRLVQNGSGVYLGDDSANNIVAHNICENNVAWGICLDNSSYNSVYWNICRYNQIGIYIGGWSSNNYLRMNNISYNGVGIRLLGNTPPNKQNILNYNSIWYNLTQALDDTGGKWDNNSIGNYWHDYVGSDGDGNHIGDTPYNVPGSKGVKDNYPLMLPSMCIIYGWVSDGHGHYLSGVDVKLTNSLGSEIDHTSTNSIGEYVFPNLTATIPHGTYRVQVDLKNDIFAIVYGADDTSPIVTVSTQDFYYTEGEERRRDIDFGDVTLYTNIVNKARLDDLAVMYYQTKQVVDFNKNELGVTLDLDLPIMVHAYCQDNPWTILDDESDMVYYSPSTDEIYIGVNHSDFSTLDRPMNREWHESFHEMMDDTVIMPSLWPLLETNHGGYNNARTTDSWVEGWAEFWSCVLKKTLPQENWRSADWRIYEYEGGVPSLEFNWRVWSTEIVSREEFAVASLLVDMIDPIDMTEKDKTGVAKDCISMGADDLWEVIGSKHLPDMRSVYLAFRDANIGSGDIDGNGLTDLDELFILHGFFADDDPQGTLGYRQWDTGEAVGWGGKPVRTNTPDIPNARILINAIDEDGNPLGESVLLVNVFFSPPNDIYNYSYQMPLGSSESLVGFSVAPDDVEAIIELQLEDTEGQLSDKFLVSNTFFWENVAGSVSGYAAEHSFEIGAEDQSCVFADVDFDPDTVNLKSKGKWVTAYVELPAGWDVADIDLSTVRLNGVVPAFSNPKYGFVSDPSQYLVDYDNDGIIERMFKFDAKAMKSLLSVGDNVEIKISGKVNGIQFEGSDFIKVMN